MTDNQCVNFLQWALPRIGLRWQGFRKVRRQVCKRIDKRIAELDLSSIFRYQDYLEENPREWYVLRWLCRVTISRFFRDSIIFDYFAADVFPALIGYFTEKNCSTIRVWSCGCACGEEPYTVAMLWHYVIRPKHPDLVLEIIATDIDPVLIERAKEACYPASSIREVPEEWLSEAFNEINGVFCLKKYLKKYVRFGLQDIREKSPGGMYHVVLCRNLAFTYFDQEAREQSLKRLSMATEKGGVLITGRHELLAVEGPDFVPWIEHMPIFQKV